MILAAVLILCVVVDFFHWVSPKISVRDLYTFSELGERDKGVYVDVYLYLGDSLLSSHLFL